MRVFLCELCLINDSTISFPGLADEELSQFQLSILFSILLFPLLLDSLNYICPSKSYLVLGSYMHFKWIQQGNKNIYKNAKTDPAARAMIIPYRTVVDIIFIKKMPKGISKTKIVKMISWQFIQENYLLYFNLQLYLKTLKNLFLNM